jgi:hypothetical protein
VTPSCIVFEGHLQHEAQQPQVKYRIDSSLSILIHLSTWCLIYTPKAGTYLHVLVVPLLWEAGHVPGHELVVPLLWEAGHVLVVPLLWEAGHVLVVPLLWEAGHVKVHDHRSYHSIYNYNTIAFNIFKLVAPRLVTIQRPPRWRTDHTDIDTRPCYFKMMRAVAARKAVMIWASRTQWQNETYK